MRETLWRVHQADGTSSGGPIDRGDKSRQGSERRLPRSDTPEPIHIHGKRSPQGGSSRGELYQSGNPTPVYSSLEEAARLNGFPLAGSPRMPREVDTIVAQQRGQKEPNEAPPSKLQYTQEEFDAMRQKVIAGLNLVASGFPLQIAADVDAITRDRLKKAHENRQRQNAGNQGRKHIW